MSINYYESYTLLQVAKSLKKLTASNEQVRIFDETNCYELTPEGIQKNVMELRSRAWSRENLMRCAPNQTTLMQMLAPDWTDWGWKMDPKFVIEAREIWGLKAA
jgi:hypothetical protein